MVDFDKFEKRVKDTYGEQEFQFDEANWDKARQMIDASRKDKNRGGFWLISSVAVVITTGLVYYFGFRGGSEAIQKNSVAMNEKLQNKEVVTNNNDTQNPGENTYLNNSSSSVNSDENNSNQGTDLNSNSASSENNRQNSTIKNSSIPNSDPTKHSENSSLSNSNPISDQGSGSNMSSNDTNKNTAPSGSSNSSSDKPTSGKNDVKNSTKNTENYKTGKKNNTLPVLGNNSNSNNPRTNNTPGGNPIAANNNKIGDINNSSGSNENNNDKANSNKIDTLIGVTNSDVKEGDEKTPDIAVEPEIKQLPADSFKTPALPKDIKGEGTSYATNVKLEHEHKNFLYMEAGTTYLFGWNGGGHEADGFNLVAGLNFQHYFTSNISAQIGAQYNTISNLSNSTHTISTKNYDFGLQQDVTTISYTKLHYVVIPVKVALTVRKDNIIGLGCNVGYLLNSDSKKEKYTISNNSSTKNNLSSTKEKGYVQGFDPFDIQVSAFYRRKIYKGFSINAEFIYGLTDVKKNDFFKNNSFDRNMGFKLTLCYDLFKK